jgi:hypothetical protein
VFADDVSNLAAAVHRVNKIKAAIATKPTIIIRLLLEGAAVPLPAASA